MPIIPAMALAPSDVPVTTRSRPVDRRSLVAAAAATLGLAFLVLAAATFTGSAGQGFDLDAYLAAAQRVAAGGTPYQPETLGGPYQPGPAGLYLYPPPFAVLLVPATLLPHGLAVPIWVALHIAALAGAAIVMPVPRWIRAVTFAVGAFSLPTLLDLNLGNVSTFVMLASVVAWGWQGRPLGSVGLAASLLVRPTQAVVVLLWLARRRWREIALTLAALALVALATLPWVGVGAYLDFATVLRNAGSFTGIPRNVDLASATAALGLAAPLPQLAFLAGAAIAVACLVVAARRDAETALVTAFGAALLLSPLLWAHYLVELLIPAAFLAARGRPLALALPLLGWLPETALPLAALAATVTPLLARPRSAPDHRPL
jgi:hypothetical protein